MPFYKMFAATQRGCVLAQTGKAADAIQTISAEIAGLRAIGATTWGTCWLSHLALAYAALGKLDDAWRCIGEAMTAVETTKEQWYLAEINRVTGEIALKSPEPDAAKAQGYFERALAVARQQQAKVLGTPRRYEHGAALARSGQAAASSRSAGPSLRLVH